MEDYTSETYKGLPSHGALFEMAGHRWEQVKDIETAITSYAQALAGMLGGAGGGGGGGGGGNQNQQETANTADPLFNSTLAYAPPTDALSTSAGQALMDLSPESMATIQASTEPDIWVAFQTMAANFPASQAIDQGGFIVHPETFERNIVNLFSQAKTIYDLNEAMHELQWNEDLRGLDQIDDVTFEIETPWGNNTVSVSPRTGAQSSPGQGAQQAIQQIMSFLQSAMNHTPNKDQNQFGSGAQSIGEQIQRVAFDTQAKVQKTVQECQSDKEGNKACDDLQTSGSTMITTVAKV